MDKPSGERASSATVLRVKVKDPQGTTWRVTRRWVPWRRKVRGVLDRMPDFPGLGDDPISAILGILFLIIMLPFLIFALIAGLELLLILLVLPFVALGRIIFGQHWTIEARLGFMPFWEESAGTWRESGEAIRNVAVAIEKGHLPPQNVPQD